MQRSTDDRGLQRETQDRPLVSGWRANRLGIALPATLLITTGIMMMTACGGTGSSTDPQQGATLSGNWQFTMAPLSDGNQNDPTFGPGLLGGFLLQNNDGSITGQAVYSLTSSAPNQQVCNAGTATLTSATVTGSTVTLTYMAGSSTNNVTFTLTGTLSSTPTGPVIGGANATYTTNVVTPSGGTPCGYATKGSWSATSIPPLTGTVTGSFHSTDTTTLNNQDFPVFGTITQSPNIGASNATVTGTLSFINPETNASYYPCFSQASVNGQISGSSVILQIIGTNGATVGQIGASAGSTTGIEPISFVSAQGGYILQGTEPNYIVASSGCPGSLEDTSTAGDYGNICLALNSTTVCQQPFTLTPATITFPAQLLDSAPTAQTITLTNNSSTSLSGLTIKFNDNNFSQFIYGQNSQSDFNGLPSFTETDACGPGGSPAGTASFDLGSGQACSISVTFAPQESCSWLPFTASGANGPSIDGAAPEYCPFPQTPILTVNCPVSNSDCPANPPTADVFSVAAAITGTGLSLIQPSTPELDFGAESQSNPAEASLPQILSFTNSSANPVQILGSAPCTNPPQQGAPNIFPHDPVKSVAGLQVVANGNPTFGSISSDNDTIFYNCDSDPATFLPNFQISADTCTGTTLLPQTACSLQIAYVPQPNTNISSGLDFFLQLNTQQCYGSVTTDCEIDSGRFPVELKANGVGPLRMSPSAGLDFGNVAKGSTSAPMTVTLLNDPNLPNPQTVTFQGKFVVTGNYLETDDCTATLAPGSSCTLTITFKPTGAGLETGNVQIFYLLQANNPGAVIYLRGIGH
jgi:hypothetical protein